MDSGSWHERAFKQTNIGSVLILLIALDAACRSHSRTSRETDFTSIRRYQTNARI